MNGVTFTSGTSSTSGSNSERDVRGFSVVEILIAEVPISTNEGFDYKHLYFIALHDFQVASF